MFLCGLQDGKTVSEDWGDKVIKDLIKISGTKPESPVPPSIACPQGISGRCAVCGRDAHRGRCGRRDVRRVPRAVCAQARPNPPV